MQPLGEILKVARIARQGPAVSLPPAAPPCSVCHGAGYLRYDVAVDDPRFGELVPCECTRRDLEQRRLARLIEKSNLGSLRASTFESFVAKVRDGVPPRHSPDAALRAALAFAQGTAPQPWLVLWGPFGTGKTHLAAAIANHRLANRAPAIFIVVPDLLDHLRSTFSPQSDVTYDELFEQVRNTPLLVLDDLGSQTSTPWAQEKLYQLFNHRYNKALDTVVTTNLSPDELEPRLRSRLGDPRLSLMVEVRDFDKRLGVVRADAPAGPRPRRPATSRRRDDVRA